MLTMSIFVALILASPMSKRIGSSIANAVAARKGEMGAPFKTGVVREGNSLTVRFSDLSRANGIQLFDYGFLLERDDELVPALLESFYYVCQGREPTTRHSYDLSFKLFWTYILGYEKTFGEHLRHLRQLDTSFFDGYHDWLRGRIQLRHISKKNPSELKGSTISGRYSLVRRMLNYLKTSEKFHALVDQNLNVKKNPEPGYHHNIKHHRPLPEATIIRIRDACQRSIIDTITARAAGEAYASAFDANFDIGAATAPKFKEFPFCVGAYAKAEEYRLDVESFARKFPGLTRALRDPYHKKSDIMRHLHFTPVTLVPFVIMCNFEMIFNPDPLLLSEFSDISDAIIFPSTRHSIRRPKKRGSTTQVRNFAKNDEYPFGLNVLLRELKKYSQRTRQYIEEGARRKIFIFKSRLGFGSFGSQSEASTWGKALNQFIQENDLPDFTLSEIRATGSELVSAITRGDIRAQQAMLSHMILATTETSYENEGAKTRRREKLADEMALRERRITTNGKADTRGKGLSAAAKTAVTPGFICLEPLFSPIEGQKDGRLCDAYGRCPRCDLAAVTAGDVRSCANMFLVRDALHRASSVISPARWTKYWQPQLMAVEEIWLPQFSDEIKALASKLRLPSIPGFE
jgi:hypothetical protein